MTNFAGTVRPGVKQFIQQHKKRIICIALAGIILLVAVLVGGAIGSGIYIKQANYPTTITTKFIGSSDVVKLGCYPKLKSVEINKTSSTKVYSSDQLQSSNKELIVTNKLDKTVPNNFSTSANIKFQVCYGNSSCNNIPLFTVLEGIVSYSFTVTMKKTEITGNCTLEIYVFDSYFEFKNFWDTTYTAGDMDMSINHMSSMICLSTNHTEDVFVVNFTLPAQQYTYIAGIADGEAVDKMSYAANGGSVTTYNTSRLNQETCNDDDNDNAESCFITFGRGYSGDHEKCVFVSQVFEPSPPDYYYEYIRAKFTQVKTTTNTTAIFITVVLSSLVIVALILICAALRKWMKSSEANTSHADVPESAPNRASESDSLLPKDATTVDPFQQSPEVEHMQHVLRKNVSEYDRIGEILGLDYATRCSIDTNNIQYLGPEKKLNALVKKALEQYPDKTWKDFIKAFREDKMNKIANDIEEYLRSKKIQDFYAAKKNEVTTDNSVIN